MDPVALARRSPLAARCARRLMHRCCVPHGARLIVGVSGGSDSVALALLLTALSRRRSRPIAAPVIVHVHHHLRGAEADHDAAHVAALAGGLGVPFLLRDINPAELPGNRAAAARRLRLKALRDVAEELGAAFVVTAHHADDQLETLLMRLARGCGPDGLRGLRWSRSMHEPVRLIRPLLDTRRSELRTLLERTGITWREDPSNVDPATLRGRMRRELMFRLEQLWPHAAARATDAATAADTAQRALRRELRRTFGPRTQHAWPRTDLRALDPGMLAAGLRRATIALHPAAARQLTFAHLDRAAQIVRDDDVHPRVLAWPGGMSCDVTAREVAVRRA